MAPISKGNIQVINPGGPSSFAGSPVKNSPHPDMNPDSQELKIVMTPLQLAAILENKTVDESSTSVNRVFGSLCIIGCAIELAGTAALFLTPEPTMSKKVGESVLGAHGMDTDGAVIRLVWAGRLTCTLTAQEVSAAMRSLGFNPKSADATGAFVNIAVPMLVGLGGLVRVKAIYSGMAELYESEGVAGKFGAGHTIAKHVGKDLAALQSRLTTTNVPVASTFTTIEMAGLVISKALNVNAGAIKQWAQTAAIGARYTLNYDAGEVIGQGLVRSTGMMQSMTKARIVLEKINNSGKMYFILTAFPQL